MAAPFKRTDRVAAELRREIGLLVHRAAREHGLPSVSVSDVEISRDLAHAKVFVVVLDSTRAKDVLAELRALARELRHSLSREVRMRHTPELHFHYDASMDQGERIDRLLRDVDAPRGASPDEGDLAD
jgi:ribosome-binding factor A